MKYKCIRTCYFANRLFEAGEVINFEDSTKVPHHFEALETKKPVEAPKKPAAESGEQKAATKGTKGSKKSAK